MTMRMSADGRKRLTAREGVRLKAYLDSVGVLTIGIGHTTAAGPPRVTKGMTITRAECDEIFARDLVKYEDAVDAAVKVPVSQGEFDALVSLCYNIGQGGFKGSTIVKRLNAGDRDGAAAAFMMWRKPKEIIGRRRQEQQQFIDAGPPRAKPQRMVEEPLEPAEEPFEEDLEFPTPPVGPDGKAILATKRKLAQLGYFEFGLLNDEWGGKTVAAISAYKLDRGLPGPAAIDDVLTAQLDSDIASGWTRPIAEERKKITAQEIAPSTPAVKQTLRQWVVAKWFAVTSFVGGLFSGVSDYFEAISDYVRPLKNFLTDIPGWLWLFGIGSVALLVWLNSRWATEAIVDDKRTGRLN